MVWQHRLVTAKRSVGRPSEYDPRFIKDVERYLKLRQDQEVDTEASDKSGKTIYSTKIKVNLPTIEGFAAFIGVNKTTLYDWERAHPEFSNALEDIRTEQHSRLIDNGLSGDYNPTIAKLILSANHGMAEKTDNTHTMSVTELINAQEKSSTAK